MSLIRSNAVYSPNWVVNDRVSLLFTTRRGGVSAEPYDALNLGQHVGDDPNLVDENRRLLGEILPSEPYWLNQVHGTDVLRLEENSSKVVHTADAVFTTSPNCVLSIMTADCLPILFTNQQAEFVAAAHAGWRGLAAGVIQSLFKKILLELKPANEKHFMSSISAWIGPAISKPHFEVGEDVLVSFTKSLGSEFPQKNYFQSLHLANKYLADLPGIATWIMREIGIRDIQSDNRCTFKEVDSFYSYRRDGKTGRMASLIWLKS